VSLQFCFCHWAGCKHQHFNKWHPTHHFRIFCHLSGRRLIFFFWKGKKAQFGLTKNQQSPKKLRISENSLPERINHLLTLSLFIWFPKLNSLGLGLEYYHRNDFWYLVFSGTLIWTALFATLGIFLNQKASWSLMSRYWNGEKIHHRLRLVLIATGIITFKLIKKKAIPFFKNQALKDFRNAPDPPNLCNQLCQSFFS